MKETDYPSLYQSSNEASISTQKWYLNAIKAYLALLVIGTFTSQYSNKDSLWAIFGAFILILTLSLSIYQAVKRFDKIWYNGRAVAESVKTRTWRFIMKAEPYNEQQNYEGIARSFANDIKEILKENKELGAYLSDSCSSNCITPEMVRIHNLNLVQRKKVYTEDRIDEQRKWYSKKAKWNNFQSKVWFSIMVGGNLFALVLAFFKIAYPSVEKFPIEPFIVIAGSALTWMQVKRFQDLSTSYNLTAHEITIIRQNVDFCNSDSDFSDFVKDAENAFSREHTQWVARKDS